MCNLNGGGGYKSSKPSYTVYAQNHHNLQRVEEVHADRQQVAVKKLIGC